MEEEIHRRLLFPGAFAVATFLWLAWFFGSPCLNALPENWAIILGLVVTVPAFGFLVDSFVHCLAGGYFGWGWLPTERWIGHRWMSDARIEVWRAFGKEKRPSVLGLKSFPPDDPSRTGSERLKEMDPDVLFSLVVFGGFGGPEGPCEDHRQRLAMPEALARHGRRRWTAVWAAWNSALAILLAIGLYLMLCRSLWHNVPTSPWWGWIVPGGFAFWLWFVGFDARRKVWDLQLAWVIKGRIAQSIRAAHKPDHGADGS